MTTDVARLPTLTPATSSSKLGLTLSLDTVQKTLNVDDQNATIYWCVIGCYRKPLSSTGVAANITVAGGMLVPTVDYFLTHLSSTSMNFKSIPPI